MIKLVETHLPKGESMSTPKIEKAFSARIEVKGSKIYLNGEELDDDYVIVRRRGKYVDIVTGKSLNDALDKLSRIA